VSDDATTVLDAGALIAVERRSISMQALLVRASAGGELLIVPAPVLAQVWRGGARQALLARFLNLPFVEVDLLTRGLWLAAGVLCGARGTSDVVDAAVVVCAQRHGAGAVVTSDPDDLRHLDPELAYWTP
jgi:predicted nucleic acid-binding protein